MNDSPDLHVFVVWSSQLGAKVDHVPEATELMPDPRAKHYWDPNDLIGKLYQNSLPDPSGNGATLALSSAAWDVWMLFDRDATWASTEEGPASAWWEHQLQGMPPERRLDPERFAVKAAELLGQPAKPDEAPR